MTTGMLCFLKAAVLPYLCVVLLNSHSSYGQINDSFMQAEIKFSKSLLERDLF